MTTYTNIDPAIAEILLTVAKLEAKVAEVVDLARRKRETYWKCKDAFATLDAIRARVRGQGEAARLPGACVVRDRLALADLGLESALRSNNSE